MVGLLFGLFMGFPEPPPSFAERWPSTEWQLHSPLEYHPLPRVHSDPGWHHKYGNGEMHGRCNEFLRCTWDWAHV